MTIAAIFRNGVFEPLERVELEENKRVEIDVHDSGGGAHTSPHEATTRAGWRRFSLGLMAPPGPDFKELGPEWKEYTERESSSIHARFSGWTPPLLS